MEKILIISLLVWQCLANPIIGTSDANPEYRLDDNIMPVHYDLALKIYKDFDTAKNFSGSLTITVNIKNDTKKLRLHAAPDMQITNIKIDNDAKNYVATRDNVTETLSIDVDLKNGSHKLTFTNFVGRLYEDMYGIYISTYKDDTGKVHTIATTQFQPTHARRAFPCFDEPKFKAIFKIKIEHPNSLKVIANQEKIRSTNLTSEYNETVFHPTPNMSTYLIAFVVHDFDSIEVEKNKYRILAPANLIKTAEYAKNVTKPIVESLNGFTKLDYFGQGMTQLDQVAIPDFAAGAMENWGLVTYRETALLWDKEDSTYSNKQRVTSIIAHEFSHMWFGNLVTLNWWSSSWLNEGFARYFEYHTTADVEKSFEMKEQFVVKEQQGIFPYDSNSGAIPLTSDVYTPSQISAKFGSLTYAKGGSVVRMLERSLGLEEFKKSIQSYLMENKFNNTEPTDLFKHFKSPIPAVSMDVVMENWIKKSGFPVVTATLNGKNVILNQKRFLYNNTEKDNTEYYIPVSYTTGKNPNFTSTLANIWLKPGDKNVVINDVNDDWIILNLQESGYYRVNYDETLWQRIRKALTDTVTKIEPINRAQIVDDAMNLARAGIISYSTALNVTTFLVNETNYYPWYSAFQAFSYLRRRLDRPEKELVTKHMEILMEKLYKSVKFEVTDSIGHVEMLKTVLALQWACELNISDCSTKSKSLFAELKTKNKPVNANLRSVVYCSALRHGDKSDWDYLWEKFSKTTHSSEQVTILAALGCSNDTEVLKTYLEYSLDGSKIRKQDAYSAFTAVLTGNPKGVEIAFKFLTTKYNEIRSQYGSMNALSNVINSVANRLTTDAEVKEFEDFIKNNQDGLKDAAVIAASAIVTAKANLQWVEQNKKEISEWVVAHSNELVPSPETTTTPAKDSTTPPTTTKAPGSSNIFQASTVLFMLTLCISQLF